MLKTDVVNAVKDGKFFIYPIRKADEGLEILTGMKVGEAADDGTYPEGTINYLVVKRLTEIASSMEKKKDKEEEKEEEKKEKEKDNEKSFMAD
jgi:Ran GTPase-activating protein (RanGAP) involved in mRNA processing and transport